MDTYITVLLKDLESPAKSFPGRNNHSTGRDLGSWQISSSTLRP